MPVTARVLFSAPQSELATLLRDRLTQCKSARIVCGFVTVEGMHAILPAIRANIKKLQSLVVGAGTYRAYEAFDELLNLGVAPDRLKVHLGHTRSTSGNARHAFYRYHPMLHSKIYAMHMEDGSVSVFIGSHNLTGFALLGLNGEAGVLLEGPANSPEMLAVKAHIDECEVQAVQYSVHMKEALSWWTVQFIEGLRDKANDAPRDGEGARTIVVLATKADEPLPQKDEIIYFEIPAALGQIDSMRAEVHIYIFPTRPASPAVGLQNLGNATRSLWCQTLGLEKERGGVELLADWYIPGRADPRILRTPKPFRPRPAAGMQQVRVKIFNDVFKDYEYLFHTTKATWRPVFSDAEEHPLRVPKTEIDQLASLNLIPPEDKEWRLVRGLEVADAVGSEAKRIAFEQSSPEGGGFILMSLRRRERPKS